MPETPLPKEIVSPARLADTLRTLSLFLEGLWRLNDPGECMREVIGLVHEARWLAGEVLDPVEAEKAQHLLWRVRVDLDRDRDIGRCETLEQAVALAKHRMEKAYRRCGKELEALAAEVAASESATPHVLPDEVTEARDKWLYDECVRGTKYTKIMEGINAHPEWEPILTIPGGKAAAKRYAERYAERHNLSEPPARKPGRRKKCKRK